MLCRFTLCAMKEAFAFVFNVVLQAPNFREVEIMLNVLLKSARLCLHKKLVSCYHDGACNSMMPIPSLQGSLSIARKCVIVELLLLRAALPVPGVDCTLLVRGIRPRSIP